MSYLNFLTKIVSFSSLVFFFFQKNSKFYLIELLRFVSLTFTAAINNTGGRVAAKANIATNSDKEPVNSGS